MATEAPLQVGTILRIESLKEESGPGCFVTGQSGAHANELFAASKPPTKPASGLWEVAAGTTPHSLKLKNVETGALSNF